MRRLLVSGAALLAALWTANAQVLYSTGFEEFNLGSIVNQFGWEQQLSETGGQGDGSIVDSLARSGNKSLKITPINGARTGSNWWWKYTPHDASASANKIVRIKWDMYLVASNLQGSYGIDVYGDTNPVQSVCTFQVRPSNEIRLFHFPDGANETPLNTGVSVQRNAWNRFRIDIDYNTRTYKAYVNGTQIASNQSLRIRDAAGSVFGDADIYFVNAGGDSNDAGYYDNYYVAALRAVIDGDVDGNGCVDDADLLGVLFSFGSNDIAADVNDDGVVDDADLLTVLFNFGSGC